MKPVLVAKGKMNKRGQVNIPKNIRAIYARLFHENDSINLKINLLSNGSIQLIPVKNNIPLDFTLAFDEELRKDVQSAYESFEKGNVTRIENVKRELFGDDD